MGKIRKYYYEFFVGIIFIFITFFCLITFAFTPNMSNNSAYAGGSSKICMRADTMEIYSEVNVHERLPMASTTKIMTALIVIENCLLDEVVEIDERAVGVEGSSIYLKKGDKYAVKELLYGLMLRSGNDSATALAIHAAGSVENFVNTMNFRARTLDLNDTNFVNPHGLHHKEHYTSAYDLCRLSCYAMQNDIFREIVGTKSIAVGVDENKKIWCNKNKILSMCDGGNGIKTGYTKNAGRCLVASAERNGITVVSVVLNRGDMYNECISMMESAFSEINKG